MVRMWFLLFVGLAWPATEAYDVNVIANQVLTRMNDTAAAMIQSYTLPGFTIKFQFRDHATWNVHDGRAVSIGRWSKAGVATLERSGNNLYLTFPFTAYDFRSNYTYNCADTTGRSGTYDMSTSWSYGVSIKLRITYNGPFNCGGAVHSIDVSRIPNCDTSNGLNFNGEAVKGPDANCAYLSWNQEQEYLVPFRKNFCGSYQNAVNNLVQEAASAVMFEGFNFCPI